MLEGEARHDVAGPSFNSIFFRRRRRLTLPRTGHAWQISGKERSKVWYEHEEMGVPYAAGLGRLEMMITHHENRPEISIAIAQQQMTQDGTDGEQ